MRGRITANATAVIGVSTGAMDAVWGSGWRRNPRKTVIYDGVERDRFARVDDAEGVREEFGVPPDAALVIHVGRFSPQKNHAGLVAIARALLKRRPETVLLLVGEGSLQEEIRYRMERAGLTPRVRFAGPRDDVPRLLAAADVMVLPSLWEGLPGVVLEALAAGVPVVASPLPGVREIAEHATGISTA